jgi:hypothetical protein
MAVLAAAIMFTISAVVVIGGHVGDVGQVAVRDSRRPPRTSVVLMLFSLVVVGALMGGGLASRPSAPRASPFEPAPSTSQAALESAPVYPGPSNHAPLPRLNLPITYDYGPGPRRPVPSPGSAPPAVGADGPTGTEAPAPAGSTPHVPQPPVSLPSCVSTLEHAGGGAGGALVTGPCFGPSVPVPVVP